MTRGKKAFAAAVTALFAAASIIVGGIAAAPSASAAPLPAGSSIVVRPHRIDIVRAFGTGADGVPIGTVVRSIPYAGGGLSLADVAALVADPTLLAPSGPGGYVLSANLVQAPGTALGITPPQVTHLTLGPFASISGSSSWLLVAGVAISAHPDRLAQLRYGSNATVTISGVSVSGLGSATRPGLSFGRGSNVTVLNSTFSATGGIKIDSPATAQVQHVLLADSRGTALWVANAPTAVLGSIASVRSARTGIALSARGAPHIVGPLRSLDDRGPGLQLSGGISGVTITDLAVQGPGPRAGDTTPAVAIRDCHNCRITGAHLTGRAAGISVLGHSTGVTIAGATIASSGAATGIHTAATTSGFAVTGLTTTGLGQALDIGGAADLVDGANIQGGGTAIAVRSTARNIRIENALVRDAAGAVDIASGASAVALKTLTAQGLRQTGVTFGAATGSLNGVSLSGGLLGLQVGSKVRALTIEGLVVHGTRSGANLADGSSGVVIHDARLHIAGGTGLNSRTDDLLANRLVVGGARTAVVVTGGDRLAYTTILNSKRGIVASGTDGDGFGGVLIRDSNIAVSDTGVQASAGADVSVERGRISAAHATSGAVTTLQTALPSPGLPWFGIAAFGLIVIAVALELLRRSRERDQRPWAFMAPEHVVNIH